jgi:hypothetical protein
VVSMVAALWTTILRAKSSGSLAWVVRAFARLLILP